MIEKWQLFAESVRGIRESFFSLGAPIVGARAPGRLDVIGGIADYSGSRVLELPLECAAYCAVQATEDSLVSVRSINNLPMGHVWETEIPVGELLCGGFVRPNPPWSAYILGAIPILCDEGLLFPKHTTGFRVYVESDVPIGAGVSSSAAVEVATMTAFCALLGHDVDGMRIAKMCQRVENEIAGAPCGIMDQVTSALGEANRLLLLDCRPHTVLGHVPTPKGWRFVGLDSGVKHSVGGGAYTKARVSAFMGLRIAESILDRSLGGYLCNLAPSEWTLLRERIPSEISGSDYLARYEGYPDSTTSVDPAELYFPRDAAEHPILENERVLRFVDLMKAADGGPDSMVEAGQLMVDSHRSYSGRVRLGSEETDLLVRLAIEKGADSGIYGAKITGGGSGGTVAILCGGPEAETTLEEIRTCYAEKTSILPETVTGSSQGAEAFGARFID